MQHTFSPNFGEFYFINSGATITPVVTELPEASEASRGSFVIVSKDNSDTLYVCLLVRGVYTWRALSGVNTGVVAPDVENTTAELGSAILGTMILA